MKRVMNIINFNKTFVDSKAAALSILNQDILQMQIYLGSRYRSLKINSENYILSCLELQGFQWKIKDLDIQEDDDISECKKKIDASGIMGYLKKGYQFDKMNQIFIDNYCQPIDKDISKEEIKSYDVKGVKNCFNIYKEVGWSLKINGYKNKANEFGKLSSEDQRIFMKTIERRLFFRDFLKYEKIGDPRIICGDKENIWINGTEQHWDILRNIDGVEKVMNGYLKEIRQNVKVSDEHFYMSNVYSKLILAQKYKQFLELQNAPKLKIELLQGLKNIFEDDSIKYNKHITSYIYGKEIEFIHEEIIEVLEYLYEIKKEIKRKQVDKKRERLYKYDFINTTRFVL